MIIISKNPTKKLSLVGKSSSIDVMSNPDYCMHSRKKKLLRAKIFLS